MRPFLFLACLLLIKTGHTQNQNIKQTDTITIIGYAYNLKYGALVRTDDSVRYYIHELHSWNKMYYGKKVKVKGVLLIVKHKEPKTKESIQKISGDWTERRIINAKWELYNE